MVRASDLGPRGPWFEPNRCAIHCGLEQVTFTPCLVLVKPRKRWTDDRLGQTVTRPGDYVVPNVLSPRDLDLTKWTKLYHTRNPEEGGGWTGALVRALDFGPRGPWSEPWPVRCLLWP